MNQGQPQVDVNAIIDEYAKEVSRLFRETAILRAENKAMIEYINSQNESKEGVEVNHEN